jgi:hypothetical protein
MTSARLALILVASLPVVALAAQTTGWRADPKVVEETSGRQPAFNYHEERVRPYTLPDPLRAGSRAIETAAAWRAHRPRVLELFRTHVYGRSPGKPGTLRFEILEQNPKAMDGSASLTRVAVISAQAGREHRFSLTLFVPNAGGGPAPVFLLLNNRPSNNVDPARKEKSGFWPAEELIARGYGIAALQVSELAPDDKATFRDGVIRLFEGPGEAARPLDAWAALAAWGWGASRALDYLETDPRVDARRVAVVGHSRGGKAALWAGAEDERFALVISNDSGEGGAALTRRNFGETLARITEVFPHWFAGNYRTFAGREAELPVDQHMLLSLIAPRALYVASADQDLWADPRGEFLSVAHASPVFALFGDPLIRPEDMPAIDRPLVVGRRGYHVRRGTHNLTPYDWARFADLADRLWPREPGTR